MDRRAEALVLPTWARRMHNNDEKIHEHDYHHVNNFYPFRSKDAHPVTFVKIPIPALRLQGRLLALEDAVEFREAEVVLF